MKTLLSILATVFFINSCNAVPASNAKSNNLSVATSTLADQKKIAVTIYNAGFGVVRDEREMTLPIGIVDLKFMEVASQIQPETVQIDPITAA